MSDATGQLAHRFHLLRLEQRRVGALQGLRRLFALGDVARHFRKAHEFAGVIADRIDHHVRPEARAVLAHAPAFLLKSAFGGGG